MPPTDPDESREARKQRDALVREGIARMSRVTAAVAKGRLDEHEILTVAHNCWIEYARQAERQEIRDPAALQSRIAYLRAVRAVQQKKRRNDMIRPMKESSSDEPGAIRQFPDDAPGPDYDFDLADELGFFLVHVFQESKDNCKARFQALLSFDYIRAVAAEHLDEPYNTFVVGLNRCIRAARAILDADTGPLGREFRERRGRS